MADTYFPSVTSPTLEPIPSYGDLMTIANWLACVKCGEFIDYDGYGRWATSTHMQANQPWGRHEMRTEVLPSDTKDPTFAPPAWATHVVWFNR